MNALSYCGGIFVDPFQELDFMTPLTRSNLVKIWLLNNLGANCFVFLLVIYQAIGIFR